MSRVVFCPHHPQPCKLSKGSVDLHWVWRILANTLGLQNIQIWDLGSWTSLQSLGWVCGLQRNWQCSGMTNMMSLLELFAISKLRVILILQSANLLQNFSFNGLARFYLNLVLWSLDFMLKLSLGPLINQKIEG